MADRITYLNRPNNTYWSSTTPAKPSTEIQTAHAFLVARLAALRPHNIRFHADTADLEERADHVRDILGATLDYVASVLADSADNCPIGLLDGAYVMGCIGDLSSDIAGKLRRAAEDLANGEG